MGGDLGCERSKWKPVWMGHGWRGEINKLGCRSQKGVKSCWNLVGQCKELRVLFLVHKRTPGRILVIWWHNLTSFLNMTLGHSRWKMAEYTAIRTDQRLLNWAEVSQTTTNIIWYHLIRGISKNDSGTPLAVQELRLWASNAGVWLQSRLGTEIPHTQWGPKS